MVERVLGKDEVTGSSPVVGSRIFAAGQGRRGITAPAAAEQSAAILKVSASARGLRKRFSMKLQTLAVHAGDRKKPGDFIPVTTPIYAASSFFYERTEDLDDVFSGEKSGQSYARFGNPTVAAVEEQVAALEGAEVCIATSSGMGAIQLALLAALTDRRKSIVAADALYGATIRVLTEMPALAGVETAFCDVCDLERLDAVTAKARPAAIYVETISNPLMRVPALDRIAEIAHSHDALLIVDSTFTTPVLARPLALGADIVVHSATKYLAGHGDALGGFFLAGGEHRETAEMLHHTLGYNLGAFAAYFIMRGVKTLPLRMRKQCRNALQTAAWLERHPAVEKLRFPAADGHPDRETAAALLPDGLFGAMMSFEVKGGKAAAFSVIDRLRMIVPAPSLGDVHTMMLHPATTSHGQMPAAQRERLGIGEAMLRLSVGIEAADDIIGDLEQALP